MTCYQYVGKARKAGMGVIAVLVSIALVFTMQFAGVPLAHADLVAQTVARLPGVTDEMADAEYWAAKQQDPDAVLANRMAIDELNQAGIDADGTYLQPLKDAAERFYTQEEQATLRKGVESDLAYFIANNAEDLEGNVLTADEAALIADNCPTDGSTPDIASGYAIVTTHTTMRSVPTDRMMGFTPGDADDDNLYLASLRVNEPLLVRAQSVDKRFLLCISSCMQASWVPAEDVAICKDRYEWLAAWDIPAGQELVVTGYKVRTEQSRVTPNTADRMLYMGTVLERYDFDDSNEALELVGTRSAYYNHVCYLPVRNADGTYSKELALIAESADVSEGYLPLTKANIAKVAFKSLGQMYGWGGMLEANDCSGYVRDVYKCFGLELARNTTWQMNLPVRKFNLEGLDDAHKAAAIAQMPLGTVLFWGGHEMIYLGQENGKLYVISSLGGIGDVYGDASGSHQVKSVAVNTLDMVRGNGNTWLTTLTCANIPYIPASEADADRLFDISFYEGSIVWPAGTYAYTGKAIEPDVQIPGLEKGVDYRLVYPKKVEVGTATVKVVGIGAYSGKAKGTFKISRASQEISAKKRVEKALKARAKTGRLAKDKAVNLAGLAKVSVKTAVRYAKANGAGGDKVTVDENTGVVTAKKGLKAGTYRVKVMLTAAADKHFKKAAAKTVTLKLVVA